MSEKIPFRSGGRFLSEEDFNRDNEDIDDSYKVSAEDRSALAQEKENIEDALLENIDAERDPSIDREYWEDFDRDMTLREQDEKDRKGININYIPPPHILRAKESEAEIIHGAIKLLDQKEEEDLVDKVGLPDIFPTEKEIKSTKASQTRLIARNRLRKQSRPVGKSGSIREENYKREKRKMISDKEITNAQRKSPKNQ